MKITNNVALDFLPIFISLNQLFETILDFGLWIADLLYRLALSLYNNLIRRLPAPIAYSSERGGP